MRRPRNLDGTIAAIIIIAFLGAILRWYRLDLISFRFDAAAAMLRARPGGSDLFPPLTGIVNSLGFRNPPGFIWAILPPTIVSADPRWTAAWIGLLTLTGLWPIARIARTNFGAVPCVAACAAYALLPWAVFGARSIWAQNLLPACGAWALFLLWRAQHAISLSVRRCYNLGAVAVLLFSGLIHISALAWVLVVLLFWRAPDASDSARRFMRVLTVLTIICALLCLAYVPSFLDWNSQRSNTTEKPDYVQAFESVQAPPKPVLGRVADAVSGLFEPVQSLSATAGIAREVRFPGFVYACDLLLLALIVAGVLCAALLARHNDPLRRLALILLAWSILPPLLAAVVMPRFNGSYLAVTFPCVSLFIALALHQLARFPRALRIAAAAYAIIMVVYVAFYLACMSALDRVRYIPDTYHVPLIEQMAVSRYIADSHVPAGDLIHLSGEWFELSYRYLHEQLYGAEPRVAGGRNAVGLIQDEFLRRGYTESLQMVKARAQFHRPNVDVLIMPDEKAATAFLGEMKKSAR